MYQCFETIDLGTRTFTVRGRTLTATLSLHVYPDDIPYDGDIPEDIAAYERGEFQMYVAEVRARLVGDGLTESDWLGGIPASTLEQISQTVEWHGMAEQALEALAKRVTHIVAAVNN